MAASWGRLAIVANDVIVELERRIKFATEKNFRQDVRKFYSLKYRKKEIWLKSKTFSQRC